MKSRRICNVKRTVILVPKTGFGTSSVQRQEEHPSFHTALPVFKAIDQILCFEVSL
jgi:hypothetical protein